MNVTKLLEYLELEDPCEFEFFENLADLVEADMEITSEAVYPILEAIDMELFSELLNNYFDDILNSIPEDALELYTLLDSVKMALIGMAKNLDEENDLVLLTDEFCRFRNWYSLDSMVWVTELEKKDSQETGIPLRDALTLVRMEQLGGEKYEYSFDDVLDFEMDQYTMTFADLVNGSETQESREAELEDLDLPGLEYTDHIFTPEKLH